ncbi:uncharacterized protein EI90DRAFT_3149708 [Cantharellus anzutake]|uniref:uncharacterized protein n=1 Tax=Cantharellus anzutake TaxID=1750568 RepID=UPI0019057107|nr:uncharacterized protein EI90DRAFT_3149708 [Cantharellus anzutake]KAF8342580.1 hypothetical protein EI90DRAFT_3149708 [Cantharellus anzutake]
MSRETKDHNLVTQYLHSRAREILKLIQNVAIISIGPSFDPSIGVEIAQKLAWVSFSEPARVKEIESEIISAFNHLFQGSLNATTDAAYKTAFCLYALLSAVPSRIIDVFAQNTELVTSLARCYDAPLLSSSPNDTYAINAKVLILDCLHIVFTHHLNKRSNISMGYLFALLHAVLDLPSTPSTSSKFIPFFNRPMLGDYEAVWNLSDEISQRATESSLTRGVEYVVSALRMRKGNMVGTAGTGTPLSALAQQPRLRTSATLPAARSDVKGRAEYQLSMSTSQPYIKCWIYFLTKALFSSGNALRIQRFMAQMALPGRELGTSFRTSESVPTVREEASLLGSRKNIFDSVPMDFSRLRIGKQRPDIGASIEDSQASSREKYDLKAAILRRAQELSDGESETGATNIRRSRLTVADGDGSEEGTDGETDGPSAAPTPAERIETILELAYTKDPKVFDRNSETRRSKERAGLKAETGWSDEQLEGWRIMLERNPRQKEKMLERHEFSGNISLPVTETDLGGSASGLNASMNRGSGRRGTGRRHDGGRQLDGNTVRDRARKDRAGNQQRRRGHDRKMARTVPSVG